MLFKEPWEEFLGISEFLNSNNSLVLSKSADNMNNDDKETKLLELKKSFQNCNKCGLSKLRTNIVFGEGNPYTNLMIIGEAPGEDEDKTGSPFVGRSGKLLTKMITAMGLSRQAVYIVNIVKCRPPNNRNPLIEEVDACIGYLKAQIQIVHPEIILCLGSVALNFLLQPLYDNKSLSITKMRGQWQDYYGYKLMPTFHPSFLLRSPTKKKETWIDLQLVMKELGLEVPKK